MRLQTVFPMQPVLFEHRPATGVIDYNCVVAVQFKGHEIGVGQLPGPVTFAGLKMDRPAAALFGRDKNIAAVVLQDPERGPMHLAEQGVGDAAREKRHPGSFPPNGREEFRQLRPLPDGRRHKRDHAAQSAGNDAEQSHAFGQIENTRVLEKSHRGQEPLQPIGMRNQAEEHDFANSREKGTGAICTKHSTGHIANGACSLFPLGLFYRHAQKGSIIRPYSTPDGQTVSQPRQSRQRSKCRACAGSIHTARRPPCA